MKIGILEDEKAVADKIKGYVEKYFNERNKPLELLFYPDAYELIENYSADFDVLFMDIQMHHMTGMEAAGYIRQRDEHVLIVFVTNLAQYAVEGYAVNAFDFILKPVDYQGFSMKLDRICKELEHRNRGEFINIKTKAGIIRLDVSELIYVEVFIMKSNGCVITCMKKWRMSPLSVRPSEYATARSGGKNFDRRLCRLEIVKEKLECRLFLES